MYFHFLQSSIFESSSCYILPVALVLKLLSLLIYNRGNYYAVTFGCG